MTNSGLIALTCRKSSTGIFKMEMKIPISAAKKVAKDHGYDQIIIIGRKVGENGVESVTTYGVNKEHCSIAAKIGNIWKFKIMKWEEGK